jgi:putative ABC transport system permease protein
LGGALLGMLFTYFTVALIVKWLPKFLYPPEAAIEVNFSELCFSIGLALLAGISSGLWPALQLTRREAGPAMQSSTHKIAGGVRGKRMHSALIASQIAMTILLLTAAAAGTESFLRLTHADLGYDPHNVLVVEFPIHDNRYMSWNARAAYFERLRTSIETIPGVVSAGISSQSTPPANGWPEAFEIMGKPNIERQQLLLNLVSPEYFSILRIPLIRGRVWDDLDTARAARVAVINETMAREFWPSGDAIGHAIRLPELKSDPPLRFAAPESDQWFEIAGVVADARNNGLANPTKAAVYLPYTVWLGVFPGILVRTISSPLSLLHAVQLKVSSVDPSQQVAGEGATLEEFITHQPELGRDRLVAMLLSGFALLAFALAIVGLYSVVSYSVAQRTNEFGIRIALGAQPRNVLWNAFATTTVSVGSGLAAGILLSAALTRLTARWTGTGPHGFLIILAVTLLLVCTSILASILPARRVASIDPLEALRHE